MDYSERDSWYFIDETTYNCPYCGRRNLQYWIINKGRFDWDKEVVAYFYIVRCSESDCRKDSLHVSKFDLIAIRIGSSSKMPYQFNWPLEVETANGWKKLAAVAPENQAIG